MNSPVLSVLPSKRGLYTRSGDDDIFFYVGKFSFLTAGEIATLSKRNVISLRKRLRQLTAAGFLGRAEGGEQREEFFQEVKCENCRYINKLPISDGRIAPKPFFYWLTEKGGPKASHLLTNPIVWTSKKPSRLDHDRVITMIHLALDRAFRDLSWLQQKQDVKLTVPLGRETVSFYPDAHTFLNDKSVWIEYANSEPSSKDGVTDIVKKVIHYNPMMKHADGKVLFIFREKSMVMNFLNRIAADFPFLWIFATDIESIKHNPKGKIFWTPKDFDTSVHSLIE